MRGVPFTGHSAGSQGYSSSTRQRRSPFTGFRFCWRKKTENKRANLFCELVIVFAFFHVCTSAFLDTSALCGEVIGKRQS